MGEVCGSRDQIVKAQREIQEQLEEIKIWIVEP